MQNSEILVQLQQLHQALADTILQAEKGNNLTFYKESIKHTALHIFEKAQLLETNISTAKATPTIKIIKQQEIITELIPIEHKIEIPIPDSIVPIIEKPIIAEPKVEIQIPTAPIKVEEIVAVVPDPVKEIMNEVTPKAHTSYVHPSEGLADDDNSLNAKLAKNKIPMQNIADKLTGMPIKELAKSISISKKFELIKELFHNNADAYKATLESIEQSANYAQAKEILQNQKDNNSKWHENEDLAAEFSELVRRRFL